METSLVKTKRSTNIWVSVYIFRKQFDNMYLWQSNNNRLLFRAYDLLVCGFLSRVTGEIQHSLLWSMLLFWSVLPKTWMLLLHHCLENCIKELKIHHVLITLTISLSQGVEFRKTTTQAQFSHEFHYTTWHRLYANLFLCLQILTRKS